MMFKQLKSLVTDKDWDADLTKVLGLILVFVAVVGWFRGLDPVVVLAFGSGLVASGKFSSQG